MQKLGEIYNTLRRLPAIESIDEVDPAMTKLRFLNCDPDSLEKILKGVKGLDYLYLNNGKIDLLYSLSNLNPNLTALYLYNFQVKDLQPLEQLTKIKYFIFDWDSKATQLWDVSCMKSLKGLSIKDCRHVTSIGQVGGALLEELELCGGMWNRFSIDSLTPLKKLNKLKYLYLSNIKVLKEGLSPLKSLKGLKNLEVSNQFATQDYAELSVHLKNTKCSSFSPWIKLDHPIGEKDIMVTGKGKPFLNSIKDAERIRKFEADFREYQLSVK